MAKKKNTQPIRTTPVGFKTRNGAKNELPKAEPVKGERLTKKQIWITVAAAVAGVAIIAGIVIAVLFSIGVFDPGPFDYENSDISEYIRFKKDYKEIDLDVPLRTYSDMELQSAINRLLVANKTKTPEYNGLDTRNQPITIGDVVKIRFRGYTLDENGKEVELEGGSNITAEKAEELEIGSTTFVLGFEEALVGKIPEDYSRFEKIKVGTVEAGDVVYISYTSYSQQSAGSVTGERIDLRRDDVDERYGTGFKDFLIGKSIGVIDGSVSFPIEGGSVGYADMKIDFVTRCEVNPLKITVTFSPLHETAELRSREVHYDVYVDTCVIYNTPEYNEEFVTETLKITPESLASYEGATLVEKHTASVKEKVEAEIERSNVNFLKEVFWEKVGDIVEVIEYPEGEVDSYYNGYYTDVENYALDQGYETVDQAALAYYNLKSGTDWQSYIRVLAEEEVRDKLIFFYIVNEEGIEPTEAEIKAAGEMQIQAELDYQIEARASELAGLDSEEYAERIEAIREAIVNWYGDGLREIATYSCSMQKIVELIRNK